jgi:hypothetical protein
LRNALLTTGFKNLFSERVREKMVIDVQSKTMEEPVPRGAHSLQQVRALGVHGMPRQDAALERLANFESGAMGDGGPIKAKTVP